MSPQGVTWRAFSLPWGPLGTPWGTHGCPFSLPGDPLGTPLGPKGPHMVPRSLWSAKGLVPLGIKSEGFSREGLQFSHFHIARIWDPTSGIRTGVWGPLKGTKKPRGTLGGERYRDQSTPKCVLGTHWRIYKHSVAVNNYSSLFRVVSCDLYVLLMLGAFFPVCFVSVFNVYVSFQSYLHAICFWII